MKKNLLSIGLSSVLLLLSGCSQKEALTTNYYLQYTKDDILLAGKYAFRSAKEQKYLVYTYRDRLEATNTSLYLGALHHMDYLFKVEEDGCGTIATLSLEKSLGVDKIAKDDFSDDESIDIWDKIDYFLNDSNTSVQQKKDMSNCTIKSEFEKGVLKENGEKLLGNDK